MPEPASRMRFLDYVEVDYNSPLRHHKDLDRPTWIARTSEVRPPLVGDLVAIGDGLIDGGGVTLGRVLKVDTHVRRFAQIDPDHETFIYVWVSPIEFDIADKGFIDRDQF
jgi:hypothetical protein